MTRSEDITVFKKQNVFVYTSAGVFIDTLRDAPLLAGFKETVNSATTPLRVQLPRSIDNFDEPGVGTNRGTIGQGNIVKYYLYGPGLPTTGLLRYQGFIDTIEPELTESGAETVTITIVPFGSVLADHGISAFALPFGNINNAATYVDPVNISHYFFTTTNPVTGQTYAFPLTWDTPNNATSSGVTVSYIFSNQNLKSIHDTVMTMFPSSTWFYRANPDNTFTINQTPLTPQHTLYVGQHITNPQYREDWSGMKNTICFTGFTPNVSINTTASTTVTAGSATVTPGSMTNIVPSMTLYISGGTGTAESVVVTSTTSTTFTALFGYNHSGTYAITVAPSNSLNSISSTPPIQTTVTSSSSISTFGERIAYFNDSRVKDAVTLSVLANGALAQLNRSSVRTVVRIPDYRGGNGGGYDIESIKVGDSMLIIDPAQPGNPLGTQWDVGHWDVDNWDTAFTTPQGSLIFNKILPIISLTYGFDFIDVELDTLMPNLSKEIHDLQQNLQDFTII